MINLKRIVFKGYKSFRDYAVLDGIGNINLIIGKNNSGKSSILDVVEYVFEKELLPLNKPDEVAIGQLLTEASIEHAFSKSVHGGRIGGNHYQYGIEYLNYDISYNLTRVMKSSYGSKFVENQFSLAQTIDGNRAEKEFIWWVFARIYHTPRLNGKCIPKQA